MITIDKDATYCLPGTHVEYTFGGLYFKAVDCEEFNHCVTDVNLIPVAFISDLDIAIKFKAQPALVIKETPKYFVAHQHENDGKWKISSGKYETLEEFTEQFECLYPAYLLVD